MENDILKHRMAVVNNIAKSFGYESSSDLLEKSEENEIEKAKHQDGDMHPNGKWVWRQSANGGKGDWRVASPSKRGGGSSKTTSSVGEDKKEDNKTDNSEKLSREEKFAIKYDWDNAKPIKVGKKTWRLSPIADDDSGSYDMVSEDAANRMIEYFKKIKKEAMNKLSSGEGSKTNDSKPTASKKRLHN